MEAFEERNNPRAEDEHGLPQPQEYKEPLFTALDYYSDEYSEAATLNEAIEMRGFKAMLEDVAPGDFDNPSADMEKRGVVELWADFLWEASGNRDIDEERLAESVNEGDWLKVDIDDTEEYGPDFLFSALDDRRLPFSAYHDYDDRFLCKEFEKLEGRQRLILRIQEKICFGGTCAPHDPDTNWRVYTCKADVFRITG